MKKSVFAVLLLLGSPAFAVDIDNLPEPTKELCSDPKFMSELSTQLQGLTDQGKLTKVSDFIAKCQTAMTK